MATEDGKHGIRSKASRALGLAGVLVAVGLVQGCGGNSGTRIGTTWSLTEHGAAVSCRAGDMVDLRIDTDAMTIGFPCGDGQGVSPAVTCGINHIVSLQLFDSEGTLLSSVPQMTLFVPCGVGVAYTPNVVFEIGGQACGPSTIKTTWILTENGARVQCSPGDEVDLRIDTDAMTVTFPCEAGQGVSPSVTGGVNHQVSLKLFDKDGALLSQTGVMSLAVACNSVTSTPQVDFSLTP